MPAFDPRNPDASLVPVFKNWSIKNPVKSAAEGRPIHDDYEIVEIRAPGRRDWHPHLVTERSHWADDPVTGEQVEVTYAERFAKEYRQFKEHQTQTKSGTPLAEVSFLTEGRRAELRALNVYTVEQLAAVDGQDLKNLGLTGRDLKNHAIEYLDQSKTNAPNTQLQAELEALRARNTVLEEDNEAMKLRSAGEAQFKDMTDDQVRDFVTANTGQAPQGNLPRKTLLRMAMDVRPNRVA